VSLPETSVSVVVPTFNRSAHIERALRSVISQTRPPEEIIVVDDGSTDGTPSLLRRDYPEVRLIEQDHRGVSAARNRGIRASKGSLVAFLDSDDEWLPNKLEKQIAAMARVPDRPLCHTDEIWVRRGRRVNQRNKHRKYGGRIFQHCLPLCVVSPSSAVLRTWLFESVGVFDESLPACEDYDFWLRLTARYPVLYLDEPLIVKYGGHEDQLSRRYWGMDRFRIRALEKILRDAELSADDRDAARAELRRKVELYARGARRRGKHEEASSYESKLSPLAKYNSRPEP
jgi:glycosyltransferase involved in cell wall biosynthesis